MNEYKTLVAKDYKDKFGKMKIGEILDLFTQADKANQALYEEKTGIRVELLKLARDVYGHNSRQYKYILNNPTPKPKSSKTQRAVLIRLYNQWKDKIAKEQYRKDYKQRSQQAYDELIRLGYIPDEDFSPTGAITFLQKVQSSEVGDPFQKTIVDAMTGVSNE